MKKQKLFTFVIIAVVATTGLRAEEASICEELRASFSEMEEISPILVSEEEEEKIKKSRPCLRTYPWPDGEFFVDDSLFGRSVSADRMGEISQRVSLVASKYSERALIVPRLPSVTDEHERYVLVRLLEGMNPELLSMFGTFLHLASLLREGRLQDVADLAEEEFSKTELSAAAAPYDEMEAHTYYTKQRLANFFVLFKYIALSELGANSAEEGISQLQEFLKIRPLLGVEIQGQGDPAIALFWNAGCDIPEFGG